MAEYCCVDCEHAGCPQRARELIRYSLHATCLMPDTDGKSSALRNKLNEVIFFFPLFFVWWFSVVLTCSRPQAGWRGVSAPVAREWRWVERWRGRGQHGLWAPAGHGRGGWGDRRPQRGDFWNGCVDVSLLTPSHHLMGAAAVLPVGHSVFFTL